MTLKNTYTDNHAETKKNKDIPVDYAREETAARDINIQTTVTSPER